MGLARSGSRETNEMKSIFSTTRILLALTLGLIVIATPAGAQTGPLDPCDLNGDRTHNDADRQLAISKALNPATCTSVNILANGACNAVMVQRVANAALGGGCLTDTFGAHSVTLNWAASTTPNVTYSVFRGTTSGGPYSLIKSNVRVLVYTDIDSALVGGTTYYYVVTAVDAGGNASLYSNQVSALVPSS